MPDYRFLSTWLLEAERERVWEAIHASERWPSWWRGVEHVIRLEDGDADGLGQLDRFTWRSRLPYELSFEMRTTRVERPHLLEGAASGELEGSGRWRLFAESPNGAADAVTAVTYEWGVSTTKRWMNALTPLLRPAFEWNHDWVMRNGATGIAAELGCRLLTAD